MKNAVVTTRKLKMKFLKGDGTEHNIILNYVKDGLKEGTGAQLVKAAMDEVVSQQPIAGSIASANGAEITETTTTDVEM
ncbi:MAG: DUF2922 domain-containing protein [Synergistaceae bacterium]|nr:DUF2922 domain-containing protein [Synergistaceae bacterium]